MVLIQKGKEEFLGIGIVEVTWKVCVAVVNCSFKRGVILHDAMHGFIVVQGTRTDTLEANLVQQLAGLVHEALFNMFLDI